MITSITQFSDLYFDRNGAQWPVGKGHLGSQELTAVGAATALVQGVQWVRIATDTAVKVNAYGAGSICFLPAGATEFFPVVAGQVLTFS